MPRELVVDDEARWVDDRLAGVDPRAENVAEDRQGRRDRLLRRRDVDADGTRQVVVEIEAEDGDVGRVIEVVFEQAGLVLGDGPLAQVAVVAQAVDRPAVLVRLDPPVGHPTRPGRRRCGRTSLQHSPSSSAMPHAMR
jgi:hypothetical protein